MTDENRGSEAFRLSRRSVIIGGGLAAAGGGEAFGQVASAPATAPSPMGDKPVRRYDVRKASTCGPFRIRTRCRSSSACNWPTTRALTPSS